MILTISHSLIPRLLCPCTRAWEWGYNVHSPAYHLSTAQKSLLYEFLFLSIAIPMSNVCVDVWCIYYIYTTRHAQCTSILIPLIVLPNGSNVFLLKNKDHLHEMMHLCTDSCMTSIAVCVHKIQEQLTALLNFLPRLSYIPFTPCTDLCMTFSCIHTQNTGINSYQ